MTVFLRPNSSSTSRTTPSFSKEECKNFAKKLIERFGKDSDFARHIPEYFSSIRTILKLEKILDSEKIKVFLNRHFKYSEQVFTIDDVKLLIEAAKQLIKNPIYQSGSLAREMSNALNIYPGKEISQEWQKIIPSTSGFRSMQSLASDIFPVTTFSKLQLVQIEIFLNCIERSFFNSYDSIEKPCVFINNNLSGIKIFNVDFSHVEFIGINLTKAFLRKIIFNSLTQVNLQGSTISESTLYFNNLKGCDLNGTEFNEVEFLNSNSYQNFGYNENNDKNKLRSCILNECTFGENISFVNLDLSGITFIRCNITNLILNNAKLENATFEDCTCMFNGLERKLEELTSKERESLPIFAGVDLSSAKFIKFTTIFYNALQNKFDLPKAYGDTIIKHS